jgi:hypothetical protein
MAFLAGYDAMKPELCSVQMPTDSSFILGAFCLRGAGALG